VSTPIARTKKDVVTEFRTAGILEAAYRVFAERGFEEATMAEIARVAGVAKGTLYLYYPSKQDIYDAALRQSAVDVDARTKLAVELAQGVGEKVHAFIETKLRYFEEHRDFFRISEREFGYPACRRGQHARHVDELRLEQVKLLDQILQQAVRRKAIRPVRTEATAFAIFDLTRSIVTQRLRGGSRATLDEDIAFAFDLTWKGIGHR
jgi:AcrR family transcriptional regulator